jgi:hypothetical protein
MTAIVPLILERFQEQLQWQLIDNVPETDPLRLDKVKIGPYKEGPKTAPLRIWIQSGDIQDPNYLDSIASYGKNDSNNKIAFYVAPREIGGGEMWYRRGIIGIELFFIKQVPIPNDEEARALAYDFQSKLFYFVKNVKVSDLKDDYGEHAIKVFPYGVSTFQGGGEDASIWRGKLRWEVLTEKAD